MGTNEKNELSHAAFLLSHLNSVKKSAEEREKKLKNARKIPISEPFYEFFNANASKIYKKRRVPSIAENYVKHLFSKGSLVELDKFVAIELRPMNRRKRG